MAADDLNRSALQWPKDIWDKIDSAVSEQADLVRTFRTVFPPPKDPASNPDPVPADLFDPSTMTITPSGGRTYFRIWVDFALYDEQLGTDAEGRNKNALKLARLMASRVALAEDLLVFQGSKAKFPAGVQIQNNQDGPNWPGLAGLDGINTFRSKEKTESTPHGERGLVVLLEAMASLTDTLHPEPFALFLGRGAQLELKKIVPGTGQSTLDLLSMSFSTVRQTAALPANTGLLASIGGAPATFYQAQDITTAYYNQKTPDQRNPFNVFERVRLVVLDATAFAKLEF